MDEYKEPEQLRQSGLNDDVTPNGSPSHNVTIDAVESTNLTAGFQPGQTLGGRYQVISRLGTGGMGVVYRVNQIFLNREFALKTIYCLPECLPGS